MAIAAMKLEIRVLNIMPTSAVFVFLLAVTASSAFSQIKSKIGQDDLGDPLPERVRFRMGTDRFFHPGEAFEIQLSPDEKSILTLGKNLVVCWDTATGKQRWESQVPGFTEAAYGIRALAFSNSSDFVFTQSQPDELLKWDMATGKSTTIAVSHSLQLTANNRPANAFPGSMRSIDVTKDGSKIATGGGHGVVVYSRSGKSLFELANNPTAAIAPNEWNADRYLFGGHYSLAVFAPDGDTLAVVTSDRPSTIRLHDATQGKELAQFETAGRLFRMAFSPNGESLTTTEHPCAVRQYSIRTGQPEWEQHFDSPGARTLAISYAPNGSVVAASVGTGKSIQVIDASSGAVVSQLQGHLDDPFALTFSADSDLLYSTGLDGLVRRWDMQTFRQLGPPQGIHGSGAIASTPTSNRIAFADVLGALHVFNSTNGAELVRMDDLDMNYSKLMFSADGQFLAAAGELRNNLRVNLWNLQNGKRIQSWQIPKGPEAHARIQSLAISPDNQHVAAAVFCHNKAYLWEVSSGSLIGELPHDSIYSLSFKRDEKLLVTGGWDACVRFWDVDSGRMIERVPISGGLIQWMRFSPIDDTLLTLHTPRVVQFWNSKSMELRRQVRLALEPNPLTTEISPDSRWLAIGKSRSVMLVDPRTGESMLELNGHRGEVNYVGFAENGAALVSGGSECQAYCWDLHLSDSEVRSGFDKLWSNLLGDGTAQGREAVLRLTQIGEPAAEEIEHRLRPVRVVIDMAKIAQGLDEREAVRRQKLAMIACEGDEKVENISRLKNALSVLAHMKNTSAIAILKQLAEQHPCKTIRQEAAMVLADLK